MILFFGIIGFLSSTDLLISHSSLARFSALTSIGFINFIPLLVVASIIGFISTLYLVLLLFVSLPINPMLIVKLSP